MRPLAVDDMTRILLAVLVEMRLSRETVAVTGPEEMSLAEAATRVARAVGRRPLMFRMPLFFHYALAALLERTMVVPLVSTAQVRILSEGVTEPLAGCDRLPSDLQPRQCFTQEKIHAGLPVGRRFGLKDCLCWAR